MLGNIVGIDENVVFVEVGIDLTKSKNLLNRYVEIRDGNRVIVGEIIAITDGIAKTQLLGMIVDDNFMAGVTNKPAFGSSVSLASKKQVAMIVSVPIDQMTKSLYLGESAVYEDLPVYIDLNRFFQEHFAIFGQTGSGKSCGVARMLQNLFQADEFPTHAKMFLFDAFGEYHSAFGSLGSKVGFKSYTTDVKKENILRIPAWLLTVDDVALLLGATKPSQLPIIEKAMKLVNVFTRKESVVLGLKNDIIARALLDILSSGKSPAQIRDQVFSVLSTYNTEQLNLNTLVVQPGYTRPIKTCFNIDNTGRLREMELITNFFQTFLSNKYELKLPDGSFPYTLYDLKNAFDFALISEGILSSDKVYDEANVLRVRLHSLVNSNDVLYFTYPKYISKEDYIKSLSALPDSKEAQIINFNINYIDDRLAKNITKIYSRLLFDCAKNADERGKQPFHIILEEAHRYVQNDQDTNLLGYNIFERITKEGRKYGVMLGLITQRPSEMSDTVISQCGNFLAFKMLHPIDVDYIMKMVSSITPEILEKVKLLQPGTCVAFGHVFQVPVIVKLKMPDPSPISSSCDIAGSWF